jgi:hypothetical protein
MERLIHKRVLYEEVVTSLAYGFIKPLLIQGQLSSNLNRLN